MSWWSSVFFTFLSLDRESWDETRCAFATSFRLPFCSILTQDSDEVKAFLSTSSNPASSPTWMESAAIRCGGFAIWFQSAFAESIIASPPSSLFTFHVIDTLYSNLGLGHGPFFEYTLTEPEETNITMIYCSNHDRLFPLFQSGEWVRSLLGQWFGGWWTKNGGEEALEKGQTRLRRRDCCSACIRGRLGCRSFDWFSVISLAFRTGKRWREFGKSIEESGEFM